MLLVPTCVMSKSQCDVWYIALELFHCCLTEYPDIDFTLPNQTESDLLGRNNACSLAFLCIPCNGDNNGKRIITPGKNITDSFFLTKIQDFLKFSQSDVCISSISRILRESFLTAFWENLLQSSPFIHFRSSHYSDISNVLCISQTSRTVL